MDRGKAVHRFKHFIQSISGSDRVTVIHHRDTDGLCSALLFSKTLEKLRGKPVDSVLDAEYVDFGEVIAALKKIAPDRIVSLDLSIDQNTARVKAMEEISPLLVLDHHKLYNDLNSERTVFIKSQVLSKLDGSRYPASKLTYDLCSEVADLKEEKWIACLGILGDMGYSQWKGFFDETLGESGISLNDLEFLKGMVNAVETVKPEKFSELFLEFHSKKPRELLKSPLNKYKDRLKEELSEWRADFKKNAESFPGIELLFYVFKPSLEIKSTLIDELTFEHPGKTLIIVLDTGGKLLRFSARRQDFKVKMNDLLEKAVKGIPGADAGGHIPAAAGTVPRGKLKSFKENVIRILKKQYPLK